MTPSGGDGALRDVSAEPRTEVLRRAREGEVREWLRTLTRIREVADRIRASDCDAAEARRLAASVWALCTWLLERGEAGGVRAHAPPAVHDAPPKTPGGNAGGAAPTQPNPASGELARALSERRLERLSAREVEVLQALAEGFSVFEIAERLNRSAKTINNHRTHILHKLGLRNTAELTRLAVRLGLIQP